MESVPPIISEKPLEFYESKIHVYLIAFVLLIFTLNPFGFQTYLFILPLIMFLVVFLYPTAKIILYTDYFYYKKGSKIISAKWDEIVAIHQDPVVTNNLLSLYLSNKFRMGGFFIETKQGFTKYIGAIDQSKLSLNVLGRKDLLEEITRRSGARIATGQVSIFKQRQKLWDVVLLLGAIFVVPLIIIGLYWLFIGLDI